MIGNDWIFILVFLVLMVQDTLHLFGAKQRDLFLFDSARKEQNGK